jgi:iron complex outermembrane receptor protein
LALSAGQVIAQDIQISGKITDKTTGEAIPGVNVIIKGTSQGLITDMNGVFQISAAKGSTLIFSYVGYISKEIVVDATQTINVALEQNVEKLDEVIVIGYGKVMKKDATGSVTAVGSKDFNKGVITSPQDLLIGKSSGVNITSGDGAPGSAATIRIRGGSSMAASNDPLIVIDGVPVDNGKVSGMANPLATINPNDIESFTILKDASSTAIYGSRASNGVIMITTKKGGKKFKVNYSGTASIYTIPKMVDVLSGDEYRALINERYATNATVLSMLGTANTDWQKEIYRTAFSHDHNLNFSGTAKNTPYRISLGYTNQDGIVKTSNLERTTAAIKVNPTVLDNHLTFDVNLKGSYAKSEFSNSSAVGNAVSFDPTQPIRNNGKYNDGYYTWLKDGAVNTEGTDNPVALLNLSTDEANVYRSIGNIQTDYKFHFLPDLHANLNLAYDYSKSDGKKFSPDSTSWTDAYNFGGDKEKYTQTRKMQLLDFYLNYTKELPSIQSKVDVTAGYSWQHFYAKSTNKIWFGTLKDSTVTDNIIKTQNYLLSFFGRLNYTFRDKYMLTFTLRNDGSSRFASNNRWGLFPSAALAWKMKKESFLSDNRTISDLKLRLGYGITGQQDISTSDYPYLAIYQNSMNAAALYQLGTNFYNLLRPSGYDANIKWETTTTYNMGFDYGFINDRITGALDFYYRETKDLLNSLPVPAGSNLINELTTNVGNLVNKGIEFSIDAKIISKNDLRWVLGYNISYNKNEITKLTFTSDPTYIGAPTGKIRSGVSSYIQINSIDYPVSAFYVYKQVYDTKGNPVEGLYEDINKDGIINTSDLYRYKKPAPDVLMGISSRLSYKNWDFSFSGRLSLGNYVYNNVASSNATYANLYYSDILANALTSVSDTKFTTQQMLSDYYIENGSYFRMDNINLGYRFENVMNYKFNINVGIGVQNAFIITKYSGLDPEVYGGIDSNIYPRPRTFLINVGFDF